MMKSMSGAQVSLVAMAALWLGCSSESAPAPAPAPTAVESAAQAEATAAETAAPAPSASSAEGPPALSGSAPADPKLAREAALLQAREAGILGLINQGGSDPNAPTAPWGRDSGLSNDALSKRGNLWGDEIGDAYGAGGLGLKGIGGEGRGGRGEGTIGLGNIGTIGHGAGTGTGQGFGSGYGRLGGSHRSKPPSVRMGAVSVGKGLPPEVVQRIVRQSFGRFRLCYENGLRNDPNLAGKVVVDFTIGKDGSVSGVSGGGDLPDKGVVSCVTKAFHGLSFPQPEGVSSVAVKYPIAFAPGDSGASSGGNQVTKSAETVGGKSLDEVTGLEVEKALRAAGATDVSSTTKAGMKGVMVFTAKKGGKTFTITFARLRGSELSSDEKTRLRGSAAVFEMSPFLLAVESDDKSASQSLLNSLIKKPS